MIGAGIERDDAAKIKAGGEGPVSYELGTFKSRGKRHPSILPHLPPKALAGGGVRPLLLGLPGESLRLTERVELATVLDQSLEHAQYAERKIIVAENRLRPKFRLVPQTAQKFDDVANVDRRKIETGAPRVHELRVAEALPLAPVHQVTFDVLVGDRATRKSRDEFSSVVDAEDNRHRTLSASQITQNLADPQPEPNAIQSRAVIWSGERMSR